MKAFVTGGTGFIGQRVVRKLLERGYQVVALTRTQAGLDALDAAGATPAWGDICDRESMREAMQGSHLVFHVAGWYEIGARDQSRADVTNVEGTRNVLSLARELGVPRIVYVSSLNVFGDTQGAVSDEATPLPSNTPATEYERTKRDAHQIAEELIQKGAPVIIAMPGVVYGPGDHSLIGQFMRWFYLGLFPLFPAPELTVSFVHVEDVAEGIILAGEKGVPGERYILGGDNLSLGDAVRIWADVSGKAPPVVSVPPAVMKPFKPLLEAIRSVLPLPDLLSPEAINIIDADFSGSGMKARHQLGWKIRPLEEGMRETFEWIAQQSKPVNIPPERRREVARLSAAAALALLAVWILSRQRK